MHDAHWTQTGKKHARALFELALERELAEHLADFEERAASAKAADEMWSIRDHLEKLERKLERKYDSRYSPRLIVFGPLLRLGRVTDGQLAFSSEDKPSDIHRMASL